MTTTRRTLFAAIALGLSLTLSGCFGSAPPVPKEQYFRLIASGEPAAVTNPLDGIVEIPPLQAEGVMGERPLLFTKDGGLKLEQRNYAYWTDPPPAMLRDQLIAYLRRGQAGTPSGPQRIAGGRQIPGRGPHQTPGTE